MTFFLFTIVNVMVTLLFGWQTAAMIFGALAAICTAGAATLYTLELCK